MINNFPSFTIIMSTTLRVIVEDSYEEEEDELRTDYSITDVLLNPLFTAEIFYVKKNQCMHCLKYDSKEMRRCGNCDFQRYCSSTCQNKDWKTHKKYCTVMCKRRSQIERSSQYVTKKPFPTTNTTTITAERCQRNPDPLYSETITYTIW